MTGAHHCGGSHSPGRPQVPQRGTWVCFLALARPSPARDTVPARAAKPRLRLPPRRAPSSRARKSQWDGHGPRGDGGSSCCMNARDGWRRAGLPPPRQQAGRGVQDWIASEHGDGLPSTGGTRLSVIQPRRGVAPTLSVVPRLLAYLSSPTEAGRCRGWDARRQALPRANEESSPGRPPRANAGRGHPRSRGWFEPIHPVLFMPNAMP